MMVICGMSSLRLRSLLLTCFLPAVATAAPTDNTLIPAAPHFERLTPKTTGETVSGDTLHVSDQQLAAQPELAKALLDQAVRDEAWPVVKSVLPLYERSPAPDRVLIHYAKAGVARSEGHYGEAIKNYRAILSEHPDFAAVRLDLARALYEDRQFDAAEYHFERVRAASPPPEVAQRINAYLQRIQSQDRLTGNLSLSYLNDSNVNSASTNKYIRIGDKLFIRNKEAYPQRGEGFWFNGALQKDVHLYDSHSLRFLGTVTGKSYWNNHRFDDITSRLYTGYRWQDFRQQISLLPFYEKRWYGTEAYSSGPGMRMEYSYLLSPAWQVSQVLEYQKLHYDNTQYDFLAGDNRYVSTTLSHVINARLSVFVGGDVAWQNTTTASETNQRYSLRSGLETDLPWGVSAGLMGALAKRHYDDDNDIFGVRRRDDEQIAMVSLWHRDLHFMSVMPKLNFVYKKVNSNIDFYDYTQRNVYLTLDKRF